MRHALLAVILASQAGGVVYVRTPNTALHSAASGTAEVTAKLKAGTVLTVVSQSERWLQVTCEQGSGYVYGAKTADKPPSTTDPLWDEELYDGGVDTPENTTALAIRGLSKQAEEHAERSDKVTDSHVTQLKKLEKLRVSNEELDRFLEQGRLAEYAQ